MLISSGEQTWAFNSLLYAVDLSLIRGLAGSRKRTILRHLKEMQAGQFEWIDQMTEEEDDQPPLEHVIKNFLVGRPVEPHWDAQFYAALEMFCGYYGKRFQSNEIGNASWSHQVSEGIVKVGVDREIFELEKHLMYRGSPVPFSGEFQSSLGYVELEEIGLILDAFQAADFDSLKSDLRAGAAEVHSWLAYCHTARLDLVGFYYM